MDRFRLRSVDLHVEGVCVDVEFVAERSSGRWDQHCANVDIIDALSLDTYFPMAMTS